MLKDEGMAELLPACNTVIFDEAHQLPDTATLFFGESLSTAQLLELARDVRAETLAGAGDTPRRSDSPQHWRKRRATCALPCRARAHASRPRRQRGSAPFAEALAALAAALASLGTALEILAERSEGLARCSERARQAQSLLERWQDETRADLVRGSRC